MPQRLGRLEEEIQGLRRDVRSLRELMESSMTDQGRVSTWMISCMTQLMEASGQTYQAFDGTFPGSSPAPSHGFGAGSPSVSINNEPPLLEVQPLDSANLKQLVKNIEDSEGSSAHEKMSIIGSGSVSKRMKNRKCRTKGSMIPPMKRKLVYAISSSRSINQKSFPAKAESSTFLTISDDEEGLPEAPELQTVIDCHLMISNVTPPAWKGHLDHQLEVELVDLHDHYYAKQAVVDNAMNRRAQKLLKVVNQMKDECEVFKEREKARDREYEELRLKCEAAMTEFDNNPAVNVLLEVFEATLRQEVEVVKRDRAEVVSKVVPYVSMELVHSNEMAMLVGKLVSSAIFYGRCAAFEEVANMKEPFELMKVKGYRPSYKKEHTKAGNDLATATFPFLSEFVADPSASVEALLSKNSKSLRRLTLTKTHAPALSALSQKATPSTALSPKRMSPPFAI
ncbi:hypothetical protein Tco_0180850 [Tanacetum coccineum]